MHQRFDNSELRFPSVYREVAYPGLIRAVLWLGAAARGAHPVARIMRLIAGRPAGAA